MEINAEIRNLEQVLKSCSDSIFPAEIGEADVFIDSKAPDGDTPLHVMMWRNDYEGAEILIRAGANINAEGDMSETPLHVALNQENEALVELLLKSGANPDIRSEFDHTPAEMAEELGGVFSELFKKYKST